MIRSFILLTIVVASLIYTTSVHGQGITRRDVPQGSVTGLEMGIEGNLEVTPGGRLRWFVTVYEIVKGRDIRPSPRTELRALASFHRSAPVALVTTDARGRASVEFDIPETIEGAFNLIVEARSPRRVKRSFDVVVQLKPRYRTELFVDRTNVPPGASVHAWGRVFDLARNIPSIDHEVTIKATRKRALVGQAHKLKTDARGLFHVQLEAPRAPSAFAVRVSARNATSATRTINATVPDRPRMIVYARPDRDVVNAGDTVQVDVVVRTPDGLPVANAVLSGLSIPVPDSPRDRRDTTTPKVASVLTDARGSARVPWEVRSTAELAEVTGSITALRAGFGTVTGTVQVRASRVPVLLSWAVEGGALIPGLPSRVFVQAFHPDGRPWPGLAARLQGGRVTAAPGVTDKDGVAMFETVVARTDSNPPTACHGPTVAAAIVHLGSHTRELCLPVDPDATIRVRTAPRAVTGTAIDIRLFAAPAVARAPVAVTVFDRDRDGGKERWFPVAQTVTDGQAGQISLTIPSEASGSLWVRARPLIGAEMQEVRGGTTLVWVAPRHDFGLQVTPDSRGAMDIALVGHGGSDASEGFVFALPVERGAELLEELRGVRGARPGAGAGDAQWLGFLAARTPVDDAVAAVLRGGARIALAMPEDSVAAGLLRDPWRSRARFVRGRLGRLMFAIEKHVAEKIPESIADVAVRGPRGWRFNSEILTVLASELGVEAVAGLDGSPLTIKSLQALDRNISFDNVARRLTRERLLRLLVALREFVQSQQLDYEWARRGDPRTWFGELLDWEDKHGDTIVREYLFDGWGQPFAIRKARGARARFRFLEPIIGYELVSAGPDGRFGTRDDVFDPFARVLPKTSLYGEAVGEEALLARLHGVELGRATIAVLSGTFDIQAPDWQPDESIANTQSWNRPRVVKSTRHALGAQAVEQSISTAAAFARLSSPRTRIDLPLSSAPRRYTVVAGAYGVDGVSAFDARPLSAGAPLLIKASMPARLRPGEALDIPVRVIGLGARQQLSVQAQGSGAIAVSVAGETGFSLEAGQSRTIALRVVASRVGTGQIRVRISDDNGGLIREYTRQIPIMWDGSLRAQHTGALVIERAGLALVPPADARPVRSTLVVAAPRDLLRDRGFESMRRTHPAVFGWAYALRGQEMPSALSNELQRIDRAGSTMLSLERGCAAVAWAAASDDHAVRQARERALKRLHSGGVPSSPRERSALLVALSGSASMGSGTEAADPVALLVYQLREDGWHAPRTEKSRPTVMARLAAGLLLADRSDVPGRQLFDLSRAALVRGTHGGRVLPGEKGRALDGWIGTVALAIAARQLGEDALAQDLVRGITPRLYLGMEGGVEPAFWLLAASVYGVFGIDAPDTVDVTANGVARSVKLEDGIASLSLPHGRAQVAIVSERPVLARVEARYVRPVQTTNNAALSAGIEGHIGYAGDTAALEAVVTNDTGETIARPVIEMVLPSTADLSVATLRSMQAQSGVARVLPPDSLGLLRIHLAPLSPREKRRIAVPIRWIGAGQVTGLSIVAYDADQPWRITSTPSRHLNLQVRPVETWK